MLNRTRALAPFLMALVALVWLPAGCLPSDEDEPQLEATPADATATAQPADGESTAPASADSGATDSTTAAGDESAPSPNPGRGGSSAPARGPGDRPNPPDQAAGAGGASSSAGGQARPPAGNPPAGEPEPPPPPPTAPSDPNTAPPPEAAGSCAQGMLYGDINGAEAIAYVSLEVMSQVYFVSTEQAWTANYGDGSQYILFAGQIQSGPYTYYFSADIYGGSGYGDIVFANDGSRMRIRIDLYTRGFIMAVNVFEGDCGASGCAQYAFVCR